MKKAERKRTHSWAASLKKLEYYEKLAQVSGIPNDTVCGNCQIMIDGMTAVTVENYKGLVSYQADCIRVRTGCGIVCIKGKRLMIPYCSQDEIRIRGRVSAVSCSEPKEAGGKQAAAGTGLF